MDVVKINDDTYEYRYDNKNTGFGAATTFTIVDSRV